MEIQILRAEKKDAKRLAEVYNLSFYSDYIKYGECPGYNKTEADMLAGMSKYMVFKIVADGETIGGISVIRKNARDYYLGALCVIPDYANQGIGQKAMRFLDREYPDARHWALETPADKSENHHFYKKFGYHITKEYRDGAVMISYFERHSGLG